MRLRGGGVEPHRETLDKEIPAFDLESYLEFYKSYKDSHNIESKVLDSSDCINPQNDENNAESTNIESKNQNTRFPIHSNFTESNPAQSHTTQLQWQEVKTLDLFSVKSNPQLNKSSFVFNQNAPYPYFTRTCLNNGISGYVEYLDEEHKIKCEAIAVGMLGMQFFYMEKDFYAGQFTKSIYPKFTYPFNAKIALYFIAQLNKKQSIFQGVLVRDFEKTFYKQSVLLPLYPNGEIAFEYIESFIKALQKELIKELVLWNEKELKVAKSLYKNYN